MATADALALPSGFELDPPHGLPSGFELDQPHTPQEGDPAPVGGAPPGFYTVTGDDGKQTLRHDVPVLSEENLSNIMRSLSDLPGVGMAERIGQGAVRLAGKAASGFAGAGVGLLGGDAADTVRTVQRAVNDATELPPSNDPLVTAVGAVNDATRSAVAPADRAIGHLPAGPRMAVEATEEAAPDIASVLGLRALLSESAAAQPIARTAQEVATAAGYKGLKTRADLLAPGNQALTDIMISQDAGMVPGQHPSITALKNGIQVGPGRVYRQAEQDIPEKLTMQGDPLEEDLKNLPNQVSDLPRSPDVDALQQAMLSKPDFSRDTLFANIRESRERAKTLWQTDDPDKHALGDAYHSLAGAYEDFAGRQLAANPNAQVSLEDWQAARTQMAKNYQAQGALRGPQGAEHFNAQAYGRIAEKDPDLLTGNAAIVGHVAKGLPSSAPVGLREALPEVAGVVGGGAATEALGHLVGVPGGGTVGAIAGHYAVAPAIRARLEQLATRGNPEAAASTAGNPALSYFFPQGKQLPPGWNRTLGQDVIPFTPPGPQGLSIAPDTPPPAAAAPPTGIPFENVLEQGGTQRAPVGAPATSYRPPAKSPAQPHVRTPLGPPELADAALKQASAAQMAFRNKLAADRLRKVAGDLSLEGPGAATGSPADRARAALDRQTRGYARGGSVKRDDSPQQSLARLRQRLQQSLVVVQPPAASTAVAHFAKGGSVPSKKRVRPIQDLPRDKDGMVIQPDVLTDEIAVWVEHNRLRASKKAYYADTYCGDPKTVDPTGEYACGHCNQADGEYCLWVGDDDKPKKPDGTYQPLKINREYGSCGPFEIIDADDPEQRGNRMAASIANYGVRKGGSPRHVFGCPECWKAKKSKWAPILERNLWCGEWGTTVQKVACCDMNGAETTKR